MMPSACTGTSKTGFRTTGLSGPTDRLSRATKTVGIRGRHGPGDLP